MRSRCLFVAVFVAACGGGTDTPCTGDECGMSDAAPRILMINTNTKTIDERAMLVITAVVTDPDGVDDLIGGALTAPEGEATYGAFATSAYPENTNIAPTSQISKKYVPLA